MKHILPFRSALRSILPASTASRAFHALTATDLHSSAISSSRGAYICNNSDNFPLPQQSMGRLSAQITSIPPIATASSPLPDDTDREFPSGQIFFNKGRLSEFIEYPFYHFLSAPMLFLTRLFSVMPFPVPSDTGLTKRG